MSTIGDIEQSMLQALQKQGIEVSAERTRALTPGVDPMRTLREALRRVRRVVVCNPLIAERVRAEIDAAGLTSVVTVFGNRFTAEHEIYIVSDAVLEEWQKLNG